MPKRRERSGTRVERTDDGSSVRRVVQCRCGESAPYKTPELLWAQGWGSTWRTETSPPRRVWECPSCWVPPRLPDTPPSYTLSEELLEVAALPKTSIDRRDLVRIVARLLETAEGRERGLAYLRQILDRLGDSRAGKQWKALRTIPRPAA